MSTVVCQGLQPFIESHVMETTTMRLKVVTPKSLELARGLLSLVDCNDITKELVKQKCHHNDGLGAGAGGDGNWNLHQTLSYSSPQTPKKELESESTYIHPLDKQSSMRLSERSLELCTERLGSETGSDTSESSILSSLSLFDSRNGSCRSNVPREEKNSYSIPLTESRKLISRRSFPPPLTTISGSNSIKVKPHREGGRLIIQAMEAPSTHSYFQTERSHGRLRLSFWENIDYKMSAEECKETLTHEEDEVVDVVENDMSDEERLEDEQGNDSLDGECVVKTRDMGGNSNDVEVGMGMGMGMEKFHRPTTTRSRCKEDGHHGEKGLKCNWEAFWVATS